MNIQYTFYCYREFEETIKYSDSLSADTMRNRSMAGNCGIGVFVIALVTVALAFGTPSWLVSDDRIRSARLDRYNT